MTVVIGESSADSGGGTAVVGGEVKSGVADGKLTSPLSLGPPSAFFFDFAGRLRLNFERSSMLFGKLERKKHFDGLSAGIVGRGQLSGLLTAAIVRLNPISVGANIG